MERLRLGKVVNAVGLKGEIKVYPYTDYKEKFEEIEYVIIDESRFTIENVRYIKNMAILKLQGIEGRTEAESKKDKEVFIRTSDAPPLPEETYYVKDLIGLLAIDEEGQEVGRLNEVVINSAQDIYMIEAIKDGKIFPVPAVDEFIKKIDIQNGKIHIKLIEGLQDL